MLADMEINPHETPSTLIDKLGGNQAVAAICDVGVSAVSNYRRDGFPERVHLKIFLACQAKGIELPSGFFDKFCATPERRVASA